VTAAEQPAGAPGDADITDAMVDAALVEYRTSDHDGRALIRAMLAAARLAAVPAAVDERAGGARDALDEVDRRLAECAGAEASCRRVVREVRNALTPATPPTQERPGD
jgi:hypothetical protein